ncbi:repressor LexA [Candidatus Woesebacteria bacterium]|nr:repressor LexA [Candidatus Woesebacteria bacterium]
MDTKELNQNLIKTWHFIWNFQREHGYSPTLEQIREALNLKSKRGASIQLDKLEKLKIIDREKNARRAIKILAAPLDENLSYQDQQIKVPVLGEVIAGEPMFAEENIEGYANLSLADTKGRKSTFLLRIKGNSMNRAGFNPGDFALIIPQSTAENGDIVIAYEPENEEATIKKFKKVDDYVLLLPESNDPSYKPFIGDKFVIQGKVLGRFDQRNLEVIEESS